MGPARSWEDAAEATAMATPSDEPMSSLSQTEDLDRKS